MPPHSADDAPHWAHGGRCHAYFRSPLFQSRWCYHLNNNPGTAVEVNGRWRGRVSGDGSDLLAELDQR